MFIRVETEPVSPLELVGSLLPTALQHWRSQEKGQEHMMGWDVFQDNEQNVGVCGRNT